jgi:acetylornithine deacetylase/succinyl-diaminopimelate desuccinylase-like protein
MTMPSRLDTALAHAGAQFDASIADLKALIAIPSVSSEKRDRRPMHEAAEWLAARLRRASFERVEVFPTAENPIIVAERAAPEPAPRVLIYGHYDVHSPEPRRAWDTDPFAATIRGDRLYARGASDMKGQIVACIAAAEAVLAAGPYPVTLKFLFEGNEESGPSPVGDFIREHKGLLRCDFCFSADAGMIGEQLPTITFGLRGRSNCVIQVSGPGDDVHDGVFGGVVLNPIHVLSELIAGLHDREGRVLIPGFYDRVREIGEDERAELARLPKDDAHFLEHSRAPILWGEKGYPAVERATTRPSLNILQVRAGGPSSAIPSTAEADVTARLVPDQDPAEFHEQLSRYVKSNTPEAVRSEVRFVGGYRPTLTSRTSPGVVALSGALETTWGTRPLFDRIGAGIPVVAKLQDILGVDSVLTGFGLPADNLHGPNESVHLPTLRRGIEALVRFFFNLAGMPPGASAGVP